MTNNPPTPQQSILAPQASIQPLASSNFTLLRPNGWPATPNSQQSHLLLTLFPTTYSWWLIPPFLILYVEKLPPKPWPLTVAGLPLYITSDPEDDGFPHGVSGRGPHALRAIDARTGFSEDVLWKVVECLRDERKVDVSGVLYFGGFWHISVTEGTDLGILPRIIGRVVARYEFEPYQGTAVEAATDTEFPAAQHQVRLGMLYV